MQMSEKSSKISKDPKCMWKNPLKSHLFCCAWSLFISSWLSSQSCKHGWDLCFAKVLCPKQLATLLQVWLKLPKLSLIQDVPWCRRSRLQRKDVTAKATIPVHVPKKDLIRKCRSQNNPLAFMDRNFESTHNPKNYSSMACYCYLRLVETLEGLKILLFHEVGCRFLFQTREPWTAKWTANAMFFFQQQLLNSKCNYACFRLGFSGMSRHMKMISRKKGMLPEQSVLEICSPSPSKNTFSTCKWFQISRKSPGTFISTETQ